MMAMARAVKCVEDLADLRDPDPKTRYHAREYLDGMETLLLHQLLTATLSPVVRETVLRSAGLERLEEPLRVMAAEWEGDEIP